MAARDANTREREFGRILKFMWTQAVGEGWHKYFRILPNSLECLHQVI